MASAASRDPRATISKVSSPGILNKELQAMLRFEGLSTTGVKADMQTRLAVRIRHHAANNPAAFDRLKTMVDNPKQIDMFEAQGPSPAGSYGSPGPPYHQPIGGAAARGGPLPYGQPQAFPGSRIDIQFKLSPFYKIQKQLGETRVCERMDQHRNNAHIILKPGEYPELYKLDPSTRVLVYCATGGLGRQDISFPNQAEIKVNSEECRRSLKGIKGKPGTTRPVDITDMLRLKFPKAPIDIELVYALTKEKYFLVVNLVKMTSAEELVKSLVKKITKASVISEMANKARDDDIVVGSSVLSLKCPLSTLRISLPCRATTCKHTQCFDALSYLQLQEQAPAWQCPICNNSATLDNLAIDEYVREILVKTPRSVDQVTIEPNGAWSQTIKKAVTPPQFSSASGEDDDDDLIEIKDSRVTALKNGSMGSGTPSSLRSLNTPPGSSREPSSSSVGPSKQSNGKRPASAVIDLTFSDEDDEDEPLARPAKRMNYGTPDGGMSNGTTNGIPHRPGYFQ